MTEVGRDRAPQKIPGKKQDYGNNKDTHRPEHNGRAQSGSFRWIHADRWFCQCINSLTVGEIPTRCLRIAHQLVKR
jgi:hypothetical protein